MIIEIPIYERVNAALESAVADGKDVEPIFDSFSHVMEYNALYSLYSQIWVRRIKRETRCFSDSRRMAEILDRVKGGEKIFDIAMQLGFSPYKLAKLYCECAFSKTFQLPRLVENAGLVQNDKLRKDLLKCISDDPVNSNRSEILKSTVGAEYEEILMELLSAKKICFETEAELRARGKPKTPDILLLIPMIVESSCGRRHVVNWIDSKGMFADKTTFNEQAEQLNGYVNRYGKGLVIYWYGFSQDVPDNCGDDILVVDTFPEHWIFPTGEIADETFDPAFDNIALSSPSQLHDCN
jgi:CDAN1-interacting nuclease 1